MKRNEARDTTRIVRRTKSCQLYSTCIWLNAKDVLRSVGGTMHPLYRRPEKHVERCEARIAAPPTAFRDIAPYATLMKALPYN